MDTHGRVSERSLKRSSLVSEAGWRQGLKEALSVTGRQCRQRRWPTSKRRLKMRKLLLGWTVLVWGSGEGLSNDEMMMKTRAIKIPAQVNPTVAVWQLLV